jgi:hypothetical protein
MYLPSPLSHQESHAHAHSQVAPSGHRQHLPASHILSQPSSPHSLQEALDARAVAIGLQSCGPWVVLTGGTVHLVGLGGTVHLVGLPPRERRGAERDHLTLSPTPCWQHCWHNFLKELTLPLR